MRAGAQDDSIHVLVQAFFNQNSLEKANDVFSYLKRHGAVDPDVELSEADSKEFVGMNVTYYAADYLYGKAEYIYGVKYANKALEYSQKVSDPEFKADILNLLSVFYIRLGNYDKAGYYAEQCYAFDLASGDHDKISSSLNVLAAIYMSAKRYTESEQYVLKGIEESKKAQNKHRMGVLLGMASEVYCSMGSYEVALEYAEKAYSLEQELGRKQQAMVRLSQRAAALLGLKRYSEAEEDLYKAIQYFRSNGNLQSLGISCNKMGKALCALDRPSEAYKYYKEAADISVRLGDPFNEMHAQKGLYESLLKDDLAKAQEHHDRYDSLRDSLYNLAIAESLSRCSASIGNEDLRLENRKALRLKNIILGFSILAVIIIAGIVWYVMHRRNHRQRMALESTIRILRSEYNHLRSNVDTQGAKDSAGAHAEAAEPEIKINAADKSFLDKLVTYVLANMHTGKLNVEEIASHMCLSSGQLNRRIKSITGITTQNYVLRLRLEEAKLLLQSEPDAPVSDIAFRLGFDDAASFSRAFKRVFDSTPSQFRTK